ncbi:MAG TPA: ABC transporter permease [Candidatus Saccharimonadales bacterium]|nr:ABC transporter permease [Candidatus Saccharimonadales bacterium]
MSATETASIAAPRTSSKPSAPNRRGQLSRPLSLLLISPLILLLGWAFFLPIGRLLLTSFTKPSPGLANYARIWSQPLYVEVFLRTLWIAGACTALALLVGYPVAMLMARTGRMAKIATVCVLVPLWTSVLIRSYAWIILLDRNGLINNWLAGAGITAKPLKMLYTDGAVLVAMTHVLLPFMVLPIATSLKGLPADLPRAALNLGASHLRVFFSIILPLSMPGVFAGCLIVFVMSLGFYVTPALLGGPQTLMIATLIGQQALELLNWPFAGALSLVLLVLSLGITITFKRLLKLDRVVAND